VLTRKLLGVNYNLTISSVDFLFENVFSEFDLADATQLEKAPLSHFRFNCTIQVPEACPVPTIAPPLVTCRSLVFDGVNEYIDCTNNAVFDFDRGNAFSFEMWIKFDNLTGFRHLFIKTDSDPSYVVRGYRLGTENNQLRFWLFLSNMNLIAVKTTQTLNIGEWYHIVMTYDGSSDANNINFYINNTLSGKTIIANSLTFGTITTVAPLQINGFSTFFTAGTMAKARVWNVELTASDVNTQYNGGTIQNTPVESGNLVLDTDINNATFGAQWSIPDLTSITGGYTSVNMEEGDRVDECPDDIPTVCRSLVFDGVNEVINCTNNAVFDFNGANAFSIETWVKFDNLSGVRFLVSKWARPNPTDVRAYYFGTRDNRPRFAFSSSVTTAIIVNSDTVLSTGVWYHLIMTYDGSNDANGVNFYVDNNLSTKNIFSNNLSGVSTNTEPLQIGGQDTFFTAGTIAKVRMWNVELTAADVTTQYNGGIIQDNPVSSSNIVLDTDINNATFGTEWSIPDLTGFTTGYTSVNMEDVDRVDECPL
jgi:hypothetical protein